MRASVPALTQELQEACRQTLYNGNSLGLAGSKSNDLEPVTTSWKRRRHETNNLNTRSWEIVLADAAAMLPYMTEQEHGQISRLASILLLGFLLPRSTGNEFFVLQNASSRTHVNNHQAAGSRTSEQTPTFTEDLGDQFIQMSLEERLNSVPHSYCSGNFGELDSIVEEHMDAGFCSFVKRALEPLLNTRPAHTQQVDLLHVIAMAIHPHPSEQPIRASLVEIEQSGSEVWLHTRRLMSSLVPNNFHVNYRHRLLLVRLVAENLVLPGFNEEQAAIDAPLFEGALPHLRASLYAFGMAAMSPYDSHWSQCGMVLIAIQSGMKLVIREEWGRLLNRLMDDRRNYECCHLTDSKHSLSFVSQGRASFCPHHARGRLLEIFLTRLNRARHFADDDFLEHALRSLTDAIEFKVDSWTQEDGDSEEEKPDEATAEKYTGTKGKGEKGLDKGSGGRKMDIDNTEEAKNEVSEDKNNKITNEPPCVLAALLAVAKPLFYFLLPLTKLHGDDDNNNEDHHHRDMLVSCGIQLLHHHNNEISMEASKLLVLAFSYGTENIVADYAKAIFSSVKVAITDSLDSRTESVFSITSLMATVSKISPALGQAFLEHVLSLEAETGSAEQKILLSRLVAVVVSACPLAAKNHTESIVKLLGDKSTTKGSTTHLLAALLAMQRSYISRKRDRKVEEHMKEAIESAISSWDLYLLGRQALVSGNFGAAEMIYDELALLSSSERSLMWLSALKNIASAEASLHSDGGMGVPDATIRLHSASSTLLSMPAFLGPIKCSVEFQRTLVGLRLDFLDIICTIRQLTNEMRLANIGPKKFTRPSLHLKGSVRLLNVLGSKYLALYRQYGLFLCQQSRTSIRTLHALCRFFSSAARSTFIDELPEKAGDNIELNVIQALAQPKGDASHPLVILMQRLESGVLKDMSGAVEPKIRAAAMIQVIDGVLKVPIPFPRGFLRTKPVGLARYRLFLDPEIYDDHGEMEDELEEEIEVSAGSLLTFYASGSLPKSLVEESKLPFFVVLLWHAVTFQPSCTDVTNEVEKGKQDKNANAVPTTNDTRSLANSPNFGAASGDKKSAPTAATSLSPSGKFFMKIDCETIMNEAGLYIIETRLGCRDVRGGEWELPVEKTSQRAIPFRVVSSRA